MNRKVLSVIQLLVTIGSLVLAIDKAVIIFIGKSEN